MVQHPCALRPLSGFTYWPVFSVFVLVPSAHIGVHGLFHSLIIAPPAAWAEDEDEVITQQAVQGFPSARCTAPPFQGSGVPGAVTSTAPRQPREGPCSRGLSCLNESTSGSKVRKALKWHIHVSSLVLTYVFFRSWTVCSHHFDCRGVQKQLERVRAILSQ